MSGLHARVAQLKSFVEERHNNSPAAVQMLTGLQLQPSESLAILQMDKEKRYNNETPA